MQEIRNLYVFIYSHDKTKVQSPDKQEPVQIVPHKKHEPLPAQLFLI